MECAISDKAAQFYNRPPFCATYELRLEERSSRRNLCGGSILHARVLLDIQRDIATIIIKEVVDEKGMFQHGPISRDDVRTRVGMQRQDIRPFKKLGDILPDLDGWNF
jgi:hypothetical protein